MEEIVCKVSGILFAKRDTGFFVLKGVPDGGKSIVTIKGSFGQPLSVGLKVKFSGKYEEHAVYGRQFNASLCEVIPERGKSGVVTYLTNNVRSIGTITANKLYDAFGEDLLRVLETDSGKIFELEFLTKNQSEAIVREWKHSSETRTVSIFLADVGLNSSQIKSVYGRFGSDTKDRVRDDPYCLYECHGVGFTTADSAARRLGVGVDDPRRVRAFILFSLTELSQSEGHVFATSEQIFNHARKMFRRHSIQSFAHGEYISDSDFYIALKFLQEKNQIVCNDDKIYTRSNWFYESEASDSIANCLIQDPYPFQNLEQILEEFERTRNVSLADEQREAFMMLTKSRVCVISGFPGTGKTLLVSAFVHLFEKTNLHYSLLSPTGIAAKRLSQVTGKPASTIHRALGFKHDGGWDFNSSNKYTSDAVIVDEMSMVDSATLYHLISALPPTTILILVGDYAQLPSVGAGYVLNNLMHCPSAPHVSLTRIYRQSKQSDIVTVAHSILRGDRVDTTFNKSSEFVFLPYPKDNVLNEICEMATHMKEVAAHFQVISPMYDGLLGVDNLNMELREVLNPDYASGKATKLRYGETDFYEGDRVMIVKNDYDRMIYNGDVGKIQRISIKNDEIEVKIFEWFDPDSSVPRYIDKTFTFKVEEAKHVLRVAYACTSHKSQGQEYDYILMPMTMDYGIMLYRNLIYTAITRAKKKVFIFGDPNAFAFAVANDRETVRNSDLSGLVSKRVTELRNS